MAIMREAESGGEYLAMGLIGAGDADVPDAQSVGQRMGFDRRVIAMASFEGIAEAFPEQAKGLRARIAGHRSEEHTSELQSLMRISSAVFCLQKKKTKSGDTQVCMK